MTCKVQTEQGEYRCVFEVEKIRPLGVYHYAAEVSHAFLLKPSGQQEEIKLSVGESYGETRAKAEVAACKEFREWALTASRPPTPQSN